MDSSLPGSSVHGIFQLRILEWVAISCSRGSSWPRDQTCVSCIGRWILYHWATKEALYYFNTSQIHLLSFSQCLYLLQIVVHLSIFNYSSFKYFNKRNAEEMQTLVLNYYAVCFCCCSVAKSCPTLCDHMDCSMPGSSVLHYLPEFAQIHDHWLSQWCHLSISSSVSPFSSCPQSFPASEAFPMSQLFTSGSQSIVASASASVLPVNIQGWFPLGWIGLIS